MYTCIQLSGVCVWLNLVTYVGKSTDFEPPMWVTSVAHFLENTNPFIFILKQLGPKVWAGGQEGGHISFTAADDARLTQ